MKQYYSLIIWTVAIAVVFGVLWRKGVLAKMADYVRETREELRKCTWPTWNELKGSTVVVMIAIVLLGGFTVGIDYVILNVVKLLIT